LGSHKIQNKDANSHYHHTEQNSKAHPQICCVGLQIHLLEKKEQTQIKQLNIQTNSNNYM